MSIAKGLILAGLMGAMATVYPQEVRAEGFRNKEFLAYPKEQQKFWLSGSIGTLVYIAAFEEAKIGQCVNDWYFGEKYAERNWLILESMKKYPEHRPIQVLIALTQKACGKYLEVK